MSRNQFTCHHPLFTQLNLSTPNTHIPLTLLGFCLPVNEGDPTDRHREFRQNLCNCGRKNIQQEQNPVRNRFRV